MADNKNPFIPDFLKKQQDVFVPDWVNNKTNTGFIPDIFTPGLQPGFLIPMKSSMLGYNTPTRPDSRRILSIFKIYRLFTLAIVFTGSSPSVLRHCAICFFSVEFSNADVLKQQG